MQQFNHLRIKQFILLILFVCGLSHKSYAQGEYKLDSLLIVLQSMEADTTKVLTLNELGNQLRIVGNYVDAKRYVDSALMLSKKIHFKKGIAASYHIIGIIYGQKANYPEAMTYALTSIKIAEEIGDKKRLAASYNSIGLINEELGNYPEALKNYFASLKISQEIGDNFRIAGSYNNIATLYRDQGNYQEAIKNYLTALKIHEASGGSKAGSAYIYNNIAGIYLEEGDYTEALNYSLIGLKLSKELRTKADISRAYKNIGRAQFNQGNYPEALDNLMASLKINKEIGDNGEIVKCNYELGNLYIKLGKLEEAKKYYEEVISFSKELGIKVTMRDGYKGLSHIYGLLGKHQQALENYKLYTFFKDSLLNESSSKSIAEMKTKYETEKKDKEIQTLESEKQINNLQLLVQQESLNCIQSEKAKILTQNLFNLQQVELLGNERKLQQLQMEKNQIDLIAQKAESERKQDQLVILNKEAEIHKLDIKKQTLLRNYLVGGFILFALLGFFVYNNYSTRQKLKLQTLRNKIASDLHDDVGSTLSSISIFSQIAQQQSKEVIPHLQTIGESSRKMLDAMADIVWTINPENDQFEKIILRMRSFAYELLGAKGIDFEFIADDEISKIKLPMDVRKNLYLIFKEATNNMVKYAGASKAIFAINGETDSLSMIIRDNGKGFDLNKSSEGNGIKNMKKRAEEIGAKFLIDSFPGSGTTIHLKIAV